MKIKIIINAALAAMAFSFVSCSQVEDFVPGDSNNLLKGGITFVAENPAVDNTRTEVGEENGQIVPLWSACEQLNYFSSPNVFPYFKTMPRTDTNKDKATNKAEFTLEGDMDKNNINYSHFRAFTFIRPLSDYNDSQDFSYPIKYRYPIESDQSYIYADVLASNVIDLNEADVTKPVPLRFVRLTSVLDINTNFNFRDQKLKETIETTSVGRLGLSILYNSAFTYLNTINLWEESKSFSETQFPDDYLPNYEISWYGQNGQGNRITAYKPLNECKRFFLGVPPMTLNKGKQMLYRMEMYDESVPGKGLDLLYVIGKELTVGDNKVDFLQGRRHKINISLNDDNFLFYENTLISPRAGFYRRYIFNHHIQSTMINICKYLENHSSRTFALKGKYCDADFERIGFELNNASNSSYLKSIDMGGAVITNADGISIEIAGSETESYFKLPSNITKFILPAGTLGNNVVALDRNEMELTVMDGSVMKNGCIRYNGNAYNTRIIIMKKSSENINPDFVNGATNNIILRLCKDLCVETPPVGNVWMGHTWKKIEVCDAEGNLIEYEGGLGEITDEDAY